MSPRIEYASQSPLADLLVSVKRPGDFCTHGRMFLPMPRLEVDGVGLLSFPVPAAQVGALIEAGEPAPYGRGAETLVDTSVRNCLQFDAARVRVGGQAWPGTLATLVGEVAMGLGCPADGLVARLYKLLVYPTGGFFAPHRDTEKVDGMVATLTISLPTEGTGGELVVRHHDREVVMELGALEPSELAFAAFYADCSHETRPVRAGHRLALVYNLCVADVAQRDTQVPRQAPDHWGVIEAVANRLREWCDAGVGGKLVWVLAHDYSAAGLSFDTLKNADAAVARVLGAAVDQADCALHAAIVHIEEEGDAVYADGDYVDYWDRGEPDPAEVGMGELYDSRHWLDGWVGVDGAGPAFDKIPLLPEELLPPDALADAVPDEQWVHEASGNEGVSLERAYRHAALVVWPMSETLTVALSAGVATAVAWLAARFETSESQGSAPALAARLVDLWRHGEFEREEAASGSRVRMLDLLVSMGDAALTLRFLREVGLRYYGGTENASRLAALAMIGPAATGGYLPDFVRAHFVRVPDQVLALLRAANETPDVLHRGGLAAGLRAALAALPDVLRASRSPAVGSEAGRRWKIGVNGIRDLFTLSYRCGLVEEARSAADVVSKEPRAVSPDRAVPAALVEMRLEGGLRETAAYAALWHHAVAALLARSALPPPEPGDWVIACNIPRHCDLCAKLRAFCQDPVAQVERFAVRQELRKHLHHVIDANRLDMSHETECRGRPYTLVCTKNRASYERRLKQYAEDVRWMRSLLDSRPGGGEAEAGDRQAVVLQLAVRAGDAAPSRSGD